MKSTIIHRNKIIHIKYKHITNVVKNKYICFEIVLITYRIPRNCKADHWKYGTSTKVNAALCRNYVEHNNKSRVKI